MSKEFEGDAGAPLPDFSARNISLDTVAPSLGIQSQHTQPDYLDYDQKGRGLVVTMFANTGVSYLLGIGAGGLYGLQKGIRSTPSSKFKVQVNYILTFSQTVFFGVSGFRGSGEREREKKKFPFRRLDIYTTKNREYEPTCQKIDKGSKIGTTKLLLFRRISVHSKGRQKSSRSF